MKLFVDSAHIPDITDLVSLGIISGCTTNPSILHKEGIHALREHAEILCDLIRGPVSIESTGDTWEQMVEDGKLFATWSPHVVVKVPMGKAGLRATHELSKLHIPVNVTLIFTPGQALTAAAAGARYVSPFLGRLDDIGSNGIALLQNIMGIWNKGDFTTEIIAASIRSPLHVEQCAAVGAHIATVPPTILRALMDHPLTTSGIEKFKQESTL